MHSDDNDALPELGPDDDWPTQQQADLLWSILVEDDCWDEFWAEMSDEMFEGSLEYWLEQGLLDEEDVYELQDRRQQLSRPGQAMSNQFGGRGRGRGRGRFGGRPSRYLDARARIRDHKTSRGYYDRPSGGMPNGDQPARPGGGPLGRLVPGAQRGSPAQRRPFGPPRPGAQPSPASGPAPSASGKTETRKCLKCGRQGHLARDCYAKPGRPAFQNFIGGFVHEMPFVPKSARLGWAADEIAPEGMPTKRDLEIFGAFVGFSMEQIRGKLILDSGASTSMAGLAWLEDLQACIFEQYGEDQLEVDASYSALFTFANGAEERSMGKVSFPGFIGSQDGRFSVTGLDKPGPALLGMDYLQSSGWCVDFETGRCVMKKLRQDFVLPRLTNGHLHLDVLDHGAMVTQSAVENADAVQLAVQP